MAAGSVITAPGLLPGEASTHLLFNVEPFSFKVYSLVTVLIDAVALLARRALPYHFHKIFKE